MVTVIPSRIEPDGGNKSSPAGEGNGEGLTRIAVMPIPLVTSSEGAAARLASAFDRFKVPTWSLVAGIITRPGSRTRDQRSTSHAALEDLNDVWALCALWATSTALVTDHGN